MNYNISLIIPCFNEEDCIEKLVEKLTQYFSEWNEIKLEVVFVDDGSIDNTVSLLKKMEFKKFDAKIIKLSKNFGSHAAINAGIEHSQGEFVTFFPADLQYSLELIHQLYDKSKEGFDIVLAERQNQKVKFHQKLVSRIYAGLMRKFITKNYPKNGFDIVMFNQKVREEITYKLERNSSIMLQILTLGFKQASIACERKLRLEGKSKWTLSKKIKLIIDSFVSFSYLPIRLMTILGITIAFLGFSWAFYIIIRAVTLNDLDQGWPTLISVLMIGFGLTNVSLGIIAEYLWRTLDVSRGRKLFIVDDIIKLNN